MTGPRRTPAGKSKQNASSLEQGLDKSRKHKLWMTSNWVGAIVLLGFMGLAVSRIVNDIRGEYTAHISRLGFARLTIDHHDGQIFANLTLPHTHPLRCTTSENNVGDSVEWSFIDAYRPTEPPVVSFRGKANSGVLSGVLQDNLNPINVFPLTLQRDDLASVFHQVLSAVPGNRDPYVEKKRVNKTTR